MPPTAVAGVTQLPGSTGLRWIARFCSSVSGGGAAGSLIYKFLTCVEVDKLEPAESAEVEPAGPAKPWD